MKPIDWEGLARASFAGYPDITWRFDWMPPVAANDPALFVINGSTKPDSYHQILTYQRAFDTDRVAQSRFPHDAAAYEVDTAVNKIAAYLRKF